MSAAFCYEEVRLLPFPFSSSPLEGASLLKPWNMYGGEGIRFFHTRIGISMSRVVAIAE